jgi:hypothetical protein
MLPGEGGSGLLKGVFGAEIRESIEQQENEQAVGSKEGDGDSLAPEGVAIYEVWYRLLVVVLNCNIP